MGAARVFFILMQKKFYFPLTAGSLTHMLFMRIRNIKSSIWVGHKGMEWILSCFANIRDWVPGKDFFCKRFRENNKLLEFHVKIK